MELRERKSSVMVEVRNELNKRFTKSSLKKERMLKNSAVAQLRKRSKDSLARPKAEKNILSTDKRMQQI